MRENYILKVENICKSFSGVQVLKNVNFNLVKGEILGLVGENGAGKSTLMNIISGILSKDSGSIYLEGKDFNPSDPMMAKDRGIGFIQQELNLFSNLTVAENMFIDNFPKKGKIVKQINFNKIHKDTQKYINTLGMSFASNTTIENLSMGQRQMVEVGKALFRNAKIIIFDEPTTSLSTKEKDKLFKIIKELKMNGTTIIYISHLLEEIYYLCDRIVVLRDGEVKGKNLTKELTKGKVIKMMVGRELHKLFPYVDKSIGDVLFEAKGILNDKVKDINLFMREGEIVGLFGIMGAGRTELAKALFGIDEIESGEIYFQGREINPITPINCIKNGMAYITENRRYEGLFMTKSIKDNLVSVYLDRLVDNKLKIINKKREEKIVEKIINNLNIITYNENVQYAQSLSGGNQQKVVLGKWLILEPKVFILDEPTRGVDVGAKYEIYNIINNMAKNKAIILFISSEMEELMGTCDRILVMRQGELVNEFGKKDYVQEAILRAAIGERV